MGIFFFVKYQSKFIVCHPCGNNCCVYYPIFPIEKSSQMIDQVLKFFKGLFFSSVGWACIFFVGYFSGKLGCHRAFCWMAEELSWPIQRLGFDYIFLGIKLFCFLRQKGEIFSIYSKKIFMKPHKISTNSGHSDNFYFQGCLIDLRVCEILFGIDAENFSFLS